MSGASELREPAHCAYTAVITYSGRLLLQSRLYREQLGDMSDASAPLMSLSLDTAHKGSDPNEPQPVDAEDDNADSRPALGAGLVRFAEL